MAKYKFDWDGLKDNIKKEETQKKKTFEKDTRFWRHTADENGKAAAIIRFLPDKEGNPFAKFYSHSFEYMVDGQKKYWIRNCINTFGYDKECPICKKNMEYWNSAFEQDKKLASQRKRKLNYISNILVVKNPANPEDEGKVFLYQYGQKIFDKMKQLMFPTEEDLLDDDFKSFVPFDLEEGAEFLLKVKKQGDFPNYDDSKFSGQKPLGNAKEIDRIMDMTYGLDEFMAADKFPTNEDTIKALGVVLGIEVPKIKKEQIEDEPDDLDMEETTVPSVDNMFDDLEGKKDKKSKKDDDDDDFDLDDWDDFK